MEAKMYPICNIASFLTLVAFLACQIFRVEWLIQPAAITLRLVVTATLFLERRNALFIAFAVLSAILTTPRRIRIRAVAPYAVLCLAATGIVPDKSSFARLFVLPAAGTAAAGALAAAALFIASWWPALNLQEESVHRQLLQIYMVLVAIGVLSSSQDIPIIAFASQYLVLLSALFEIDEFKSVDETTKLVYPQSKSDFV